MLPRQIIQRRTTDIANMDELSRTKWGSARESVECRTCVARCGVEGGGIFKLRSWVPGWGSCHVCCQNQRSSYSGICCPTAFSQRGLRNQFPFWHRVAVQQQFGYTIRKPAILSRWRPGSRTNPKHPLRHQLTCAAIDLVWLTLAVQIRRYAVDRIIAAIPHPRSGARSGQNAAEAEQNERIDPGK